MKIVSDATETLVQKHCLQLIKTRNLRFCDVCNTLAMATMKIISLVLLIISEDNFQFVQSNQQTTTHNVWKDVSTINDSANHHGDNNTVNAFPKS